MTLACLPFLLQLLGTVARKNSSSQSAAIGAAHEMNLRQITDGTNGPLALNKAKGPDRTRLRPIYISVSPNTISSVPMMVTTSAGM